MKTNEVIKQGLLNLLHENDDVVVQELNETANNVKKSQEAIFMSLKHKMKMQQRLLVNKDNFSKSSKILKTFLITLVKPDQQYYKISL